MNEAHNCAFVNCTFLYGYIKRHRMSAMSLFANSLQISILSKEMITNIVPIYLKVLQWKVLSLPRLLFCWMEILECAIVNKINSLSGTVYGCSSDYKVHFMNWKWKTLKAFLDLNSIEDGIKANSHIAFSFFSFFPYFICSIHHCCLLCRNGTFILLMYFFVNTVWFFRRVYQ